MSSGSVYSPLGDKSGHGFASSSSSHDAFEIGDGEETISPPLAAPSPAATSMEEKCQLLLQQAQSMWIILTFSWMKPLLTLGLSAAVTSKSL